MKNLNTMTSFEIREELVDKGINFQWATEFIAKDQKIDAKYGLGFWNNGNMTINGAMEFIDGAIEIWDHKEGIFSNLP